MPDTLAAARSLIEARLKELEGEAKRLEQELGQLAGGQPTGLPPFRATG